MTKVEFPKFLGDDVKGQFIRLNGENVSWDVYKSGILQRFGTVRVDISEEHAVSFYLGGLPAEIEMGVGMFRPKILADAYSLTNYQEATLEAVKKKSKIAMTFAGGRVRNGMGQGSHSKPPLLSLPVPNTMVLADKEDEYFEAKEGDKELVVPNKIPQISLNALNGANTFQTMRVTGKGGVSRETFNTDMMILTLGVCKMVLGIQWLATHGDIKCNFSQLRMELMYKNKRMTLRCTLKAAMHLMDGKHQSKNFKIGNKGDAVLIPELDKVVQDFDDVFALTTELPPQKIHDHRIPLIPNAQPVNIMPYRHPPMQKDAIEVMVKELLDSGVIKPSNSPLASPIVMVKKKDNTWRMCVDYRQLNKNTIKDKFPIPIIKELIEELHGATIFSKLDLRSGYLQIRMYNDDIAKTVFKTHQGHYEFLVMPFGLTNAPSTFQALINEVFQPYIRKFTLVFFNDILMYNSTIDEHVQHLSTILETMRQNTLFAKKSKCVFGTSHVEYLGHVIYAEGVATDPSKISAMVEWPTPTNVKRLRGFLRLTDYYRRFIKFFTKISRPLSQLLKKGGYKWSNEAQLAFKTLKEAMMKALVLALLDFTQLFVVKTDASRVAVLLALDKWRGYLLDMYFTIKTDHFSLKYLLDQRITTPTHMKWLPKLMGFDYVVIYKKGSENGAADALSRVQTSELFSLITTLVTIDLAKKTEDSWVEDGKLKGKIVVGQNEQLRTELLQYFHGGSVERIMDKKTKSSQKQQNQARDWKEREEAKADDVHLSKWIPKPSPKIQNPQNNR
ncbi:transposon ty3-G gag-pol polyprotein [Tanacetum coccineum]